MERAKTARIKAEQEQEENRHKAEHAAAEAKKKDTESKMELLYKQEALGAIAEKDGEYREALKQVYTLHAGEFKLKILCHCRHVSPNFISVAFDNREHVNCTGETGHT